MIIITGGAGMIGSMIAWHFNQFSHRSDILIVDDIHHPEQWQNMVKRRYMDYLHKDELPAFLATNPDVDAIIHMGAISATTERDFNKLLQDNIRYSQQLWHWCSEQQVPFFYASSAATYGDGNQGYDDLADNQHLRPLNGYGYSKQFFDLWAQEQAASAHEPIRWAGFKFFNVYGPNEYHKERMASVAFHTFNQVQQTGSMKLFKSHLPEYADGMQMRDFVYVKDAAAVLVHFVENHCNNGIYNIGSGKARAFKDLAAAVMTSMGREPSIEYIDMPQDLLGKYQYFTQATMQKLRDEAGYTLPFHTLEEGVADYVQNYLMQPDPYA